jgi:hypothetical protein
MMFVLFVSAISSPLFHQSLLMHLICKPLMIHPRYYHIWHFLYEYSSIDTETKIHHIVSVFFVGACGILLPYGYTLDEVDFFMCGLPGGLDYICLTLVKLNAMSSMTEKYINRWLNLLVRYPGMSLGCYIAVINYIRGNAPWFSQPIHLLYAIPMILHELNAIYYCDKVCPSYLVIVAHKSSLFFWRYIDS